MKNVSLSQFFDLLWQDYVETNPPAKRIYDLFVAQGEKVVNDHVAFRTFDHSSINVDVLGSIFTKHGYKAKGEYHFKQKRLFAKHFEHADPGFPLVFISQLNVGDFDTAVQQLIQGLIDQIPENFTHDADFIFSGRPWNVSYETYLDLKDVSEYAAWMAAYGFRPNHFTVSVNHLKHFHGIRDVNQFLKDNGFQLNDAGGEVKGTPGDLLEQSSTIAYNKQVTFTDGVHIVPACYYEFAMRYPKPDGELFRGFVTGSADKIFESTDRGQDMS